ncbi:MAG: recombinase family protein, partial [Promethearchaeota archaeon]
IPEKRCAAIYCRVSSAKQKADLLRQESFLLNSAKKEHSIIRTYKDFGSGLNDARSGYLRMIRDAFSHKFDTVFLSYIDRLSRFGTKPLLNIFKMLHIEWL